MSAATHRSLLQACFWHTAKNQDQVTTVTATFVHATIVFTQIAIVINEYTQIERTNITKCESIFISSQVKYSEIETTLQYHADVILSRLFDTMYHADVILYLRQVFDTEKNVCEMCSLQNFAYSYISSTMCNFENCFFL